MTDASPTAAPDRLSVAEKIAAAVADARSYGPRSNRPRHGVGASMFARARIDRLRARRLLTVQAARGDYAATTVLYAVFGAQYPAATG